jgi:hypothetical protein
MVLIALTPAAIAPPPADTPTHPWTCSQQLTACTSPTSNHTPAKPALRPALPGARRCAEGAVLVLDVAAAREAVLRRRSRAVLRMACMTGRWGGRLN